LRVRELRHNTPMKKDKRIRKMFTPYSIQVGLKVLVFPCLVCFVGLC